MESSVSLTRPHYTMPTVTIVCCLVFGASCFAQATRPKATPSAHFAHPAQTEKNDVSECSAPIDRSVPRLPGTKRLTYGCDGSCKERDAEVAEALDKLMTIEGDRCFRDFFAVQPPLDEPHVNTNNQIVDDLTTLPASLKIHFNNRPTIGWLGMTACGGEDPNHPGNIDTKKGCWKSYDLKSRASYLGHEISHSIGYTHLCTTKHPNLAVGNELTVPWVVDAAVEFCWSQVIEGKPRRAPQPLERTPAAYRRSDTASK